MTPIIKYVLDHGGQLFSDKAPLDSLNQEIAENFYPERANFTAQRYLGADYAANLMTSYPVMIRRDLGNTYSSMLRPTAKDWFETRSDRPDKEDTEAKQFLQWLTKMQKNAMYDRRAMLTKATKECDQDFATFGMGVIKAEIVRPRDGGIPHLLHRNWHLRDCAWAQNDYGVVDQMYRKWDDCTARDQVRLWPKTVHHEVNRWATETPGKKCPVWHCMIPTDIYDGFEGAKKIRQPFVSVFIDVAHELVLEELGSWEFGYVVPRWQTVSGSQYGMSPATMCMLPDARLAQAITLVLLEAGQKAVNPPMIAVEDAIRSDIAIFAGGVTNVDADYDEKLGEVLRPISQDTKGMQFGLELIRDIREQLKEGFYLNKLNLPPTAGSQGGRDMTAYEVAQRVQEFIRNALPLFEPVEEEYNGALCELDLKLIFRNDPSLARMVPDSLKGRDWQFSFDSPLHDAIEKQKVGQFQEAAQIIASAQGFDPSAGMIIDGQKATRDVMLGAVPASWLRTEDEVAKMASNAAAAAKQQQMLDMLGKGASAAKDLGSAAQSSNTGQEVVAPQ